MKNLPNKASELIRLAIGDLEKAEASERYVIDMGNWHTPENLIKEPLYSDKCIICLAGAVMAFSLDIDPGIHCEPVDLDAVNGWKLRALNSFRGGCIRLGLKYLYAANTGRIASWPSEWPDQSIFKALEEKFEYYFGRRALIGGSFDAYEQSPEEFKNKMREMADALAAYDF